MVSSNGRLMRRSLGLNWLGCLKGAETYLNTAAISTLIYTGRLRVGAVAMASAGRAILGSTGILERASEPLVLRGADVCRSHFFDPE